MDRRNLGNGLALARTVAADDPAESGEHARIDEAVTRGIEASDATRFAHARGWTSPSEIQSPASDGAIGMFADRYVLQHELGRGGCGSVYHAYDTVVGEHVALKFLENADVAQQLEPLRAELKAARGISDRAVVRVFDIVKDTSNRVALSMEYVEGTTLDTWLATNPRERNFDGLLRLIAPIARALGEVHAKGIVHRDLKPSNIMVRTNGEPVIMDFGISRVVKERPAGEIAAESMHESTVVGTPLYMAPEQLAGSRDVGPAADIYAIGLILFEAAAEHIPNRAETYRRLEINRRKEAPSLWDERSDLPEAFCEIVDRCLEVDPAKRYANGSELFEALEELPAWANAPSSSRRIARVEMVSVMPKEIKTARTRPLTWREKLLRNRSLMGALVGVAFVAAAAPLVRHSVNRYSNVAAAAVSPLAAGPHTIAVLGPKNGTGEAGDEWLSVAFGELLTSALGVNGMQTVSGENVANLTRDLRVGDPTALTGEMLKRVGAHSGADLVASGSYSVTGGKLRVAMVVRDVASGNTVAVGESEGAESDFAGVAQRASGQLRQAMNLAPLTSVDQTNVRAALPANVEAARAYTGGVERRRAYELEGARVHFEEAAKLDGKHALTHAALAQVASDLGDGTKAEAEGKLAVELSKGLSREQRLLSEGLYAMQVSDATTAIDRYKALSTMAPMNVDYRLLLVAAQMNGKRFADARKTLDAARAIGAWAKADPRIDRWEASLAMWQNDGPTSLRAARAAAEKAQTTGALSILADARMFEAIALSDLGKRSEALEALDSAVSLYRSIGDQLHENYIDVLRANFANDVGQLNAARAIYVRAVGSAVEIHAYRQGQDFLTTLASLSYAVGDLRGASDSLVRADAIPALTETSERSAIAMRIRAAIARAHGDMHGALVLAKEALARQRAFQDDAETVLALEEYSRILTTCGEPAQALEYGEQAEKLASSGAPDLLIAGRVATARALLRSGKYAAAEARLVAIIGDSTQRYSFVLQAKVLLAEAMQKQGKLQQATAVLDASPRPEEAEDLHIRFAAIRARLTLQTGSSKSNAQLNRLRVVIREAEDNGMLESAAESRRLLRDSTLTPEDRRTAGGARGFGDELLARSDLRAPP